ncbi:porin family protein [Flavobacterium restrictum]|uniref:PorT family protein n=1 Tax=Flavobacterium restrictum TaxID=2594428 RepID=A0A553DXX5_9FLAO|nr:porin family protein [Flavobacterium restrictum]TRX37542.1 PorT family protein [Flavobacterium restrictum]
MKKSKTSHFLAIACIVVISFSAKAQSDSPKFGVKGGFNFSNLYTDTVDDNNVLMGFNLGIYAKMPITQNFAVQTELYYTTKGAELVYNNAFANGTARFRLNYLEIPVLAVVNITKNFNIHAGPYLGYLVDGKVTNKSNSTLFDYENNLDTNDFNRFDAGIAAGFGVDIDAMSFGVRYNYGLTKVGKEQNYSGTNYTFPDAKNSVLNVYASFALN